jgi:hypothetical protein
MRLLETKKFTYLDIHEKEPTNHEEDRKVRSWAESYWQHNSRPMYDYTI